MAEVITQDIELVDGTVIDSTALKHIHTTSKGNVEISTNAAQKLNIETGDNIAIKCDGNLQLDTDHYTKATDKDEFKLKAICADKNSVVGLNIEAGGLKFLTKAVSTLLGWDPNEFKLKFQKTKDTWAKLKMHAASIDLRARSTGAGTGGGIAVQIAGVDSNIHANKFKIETDQKADVTIAQSASIHDGEGGEGIEIVTISPMLTSIYTKDYRFRANAPVYAVTREAPIPDPDNTGSTKTDYKTNPSDDSKDFITDSNPVTWADIIACVKWYKANH